MPARSVPAASAAITTKASIHWLARILFSWTERDAWRGTRARRHDTLRMLGTEGRHRVGRDLGFIHVEASQIGQLAQSRERGVTDRGVRQIEAGQAVECLERRRRGVVDAADVP